MEYITYKKFFLIMNLFKESYEESFDIKIDCRNDYLLGHVILRDIDKQAWVDKKYRAKAYQWLKTANIYFLIDIMPESYLFKPSHAYYSAFKLIHSSCLRFMNS